MNTIKRALTIIISGPVPVPNEHFPRSSIGLGLMIPLRYACPLAALLAICLLLDLVAAAPLPGVAWSKLEIWEGSAAADVWLHPDDYLDFRKYALSGLSDLGFLDHLLDRFADTLRVISGVGGKTLMTCILVTAADRLRVLRASGRGRRATRSQDAAANSDEEEKSDESISKGYTLEELQTRAYDYVSRLLRDGPISRVLSSLRDDAGGVDSFNVLEFFSEMDMRFFPITEEDREAACDSYSAFACDPASHYRASRSDRTSWMAHERSCGSAYTSSLIRIDVAESLGKVRLSS